MPIKSRQFMRFWDNQKPVPEHADPATQRALRRAWFRGIPLDQLSSSLRSCKKPPLPSHSASV